jgi:F-type H+-transporting ATPase subunit delta
VTGRLGKRYARALLDLARSEGTMAAVGEELASAVAVLEEPRLRPLLLSPAIDAGTRRRTAKAVVSALRLSTTVANFVSLLADRDRLAILPDACRWYEELLDRELGRVRVTIRAAAPLSAGEKSAMVELARRLTGREVIATTELAAELLGGVVLDVGGTVYDGSVRTQLVRLSKQMAEGGA